MRLDDKPLEVLDDLADIYDKKPDVGHRKNNDGARAGKKGGMGWGLKQIPKWKRQLIRVSRKR
jgi:hypothetical protein